MIYILLTPQEQYLPHIIIHSRVNVAKVLKNWPWPVLERNDCQIWAVHHLVLMHGPEARPPVFLSRHKESVEFKRSSVTEASDKFRPDTVN